MDRIAVIGIGKMGLCFALNLERAGYEVLGIDLDAEYIQRINHKSFRSQEPGLNESLLNSVNFQATTQIDALLNFQCQLIFIMIATPDSKDQGYDHTALNNVISLLAELSFAEKRIDIVISCTTIPGYGDSKYALLNKEKYHLSYSPQFIAQGTIFRDQQYPDQVLIGEADAVAGEKIEAVYKNICLNNPEVHRMPVLSAEITKLATNCFLTMKISFANAIGDLASAMGGDADKILNAIGSDSRIGKKFLGYGFGYGGPCLPRDNRALEFITQKNGIELFLSRASDAANRQHLDFQFEQFMYDYPESEPIHFYSITYKKETIILEESQQLALAVKLAKAGKKVIIHERTDVIKQLQEQFGDLFELDPR